MSKVCYSVFDATCASLPGSDANALRQLSSVSLLSASVEDCTGDDADGRYYPLHYPSYINISVCRRDASQSAAASAAIHLLQSYDPPLSTNNAAARTRIKCCQGSFFSVAKPNTTVKCTTASKRRLKSQFLFTTEFQAWLLYYANSSLVLQARTLLMSLIFFCSHQHALHAERDIVFTNSVRLSVRPMSILCLNGWIIIILFDTL